MKTRLLLTLIACLLALSSWAKGTKIGGIHYELNLSKKTASVTYTGSSYRDNTYSGSITIPASVNYSGTTYSVTSIGNYAFFRCTGLTSITIPNSVTSIGGEAFSGCSALTSITIPSSVTSIGDEAFSGCSGLTSITIPNSVTSIGYYAFSGCSGLTSITIPSSVTTIGFGAFWGCTGLTSITIPSSVTSIRGSAFSGCTGLTSIKVEAGNTKYDSRNNCNVIIETASNTLIAGCKTTTIPSSVTSIGDYAFYGCTDLTSITIPESVTSIGSYAFEGCTGLTSITIPSSVTSIGNYAFMDCSGLTSITIPSSVTSIGERTFYGCTGLTSITIPSSVTSIGNYAFYGCTDLTSITIPESVTSIGSYAFEGCTGLTSITIPSSVTSIGNYAFFRCTSLTSITIPSSVTSIGESAFSGCSALTSITIPESVTSIGVYAFYGCTGLTSIKVEAGNTKYDSRNNCNAIIGTASNTLIVGCKTTTIPSSVTSIGDYAFYGCTGLTSITIPSSVTSIGECAFYGCTGLTSIKVEAGNTKYDSRDNCNAIIETASNTLVAGCKTTTIPSSVTSIGDYALYGCTGLTSITIPSSVTSIGTEAFYGCTLNPLIIYYRQGFRKDMFTGLNTESVVYVPESQVETVKGYFEGTVLPIFELSENAVTIQPYIKGAKISLGSLALSNGAEPTHISVKLDGVEIEGMETKTDTLLTGLTEHKTYTITIENTYEGAYAIYTKNFTTKDRGVNRTYGPYSITQTTCEAGYASAYTDITTGDIIETGMGVNKRSYKRGEKVTGLTPNSTYSVTYYVKYADGTRYTSSGSFTTRGVSPSVGVVASPSSARFTTNYSQGDAHVNSAVLTFGGKTISDGQLTGLKPSTKYTVTYTVKTQEGSTETVNKEFTTTVLTMATQQPKVISAGNVIVAAETNLDEAETNVGFEWRRTDWTDDFASNSGAAYLYGGTMEGYIRNLYTEKLWKYRPYYEASDGTRYYGDWVGLDPTNTSYFEPTVHTYATINVQSNTASVKGYAMRGTDNVAQQGFKYWKVSSSTRGFDEAGSRLMAVDIPAYAQTITASGQVMTATLTNLEYASDYCCVAFVTTTEGETFYGELQTFRTGEDVTGIGHVVINATDEANGTPTIVGYYNLQGQRIAEPQKGIVIVRYSDGTSRKMYVR